MPAMLTSCLFERPELTEDGEPGVDPTLVVVHLDLNLQFALPYISEAGETIERPQTDGKETFRHRFVIEAYDNRMLAARKVVYQDIQEGRSELNLPVDFKLHARNYEIAVWSDYVPLPDAEGMDEEYFWNTTSTHLVTVLSADYSRANHEFEDAFSGKASVDLRPFADRWGAELTVPLELKRPVARYALVADDVTQFLKRAAKNGADGEAAEYLVRVKYTGFVDVGYNVLDEIARQGLTDILYERTLRIDELKDRKSVTLAFDYVPATPGALADIPMALEVIDADGKAVAATKFLMSVKAGTNRVLTHTFLTANPDGGVDFDPGYDGEVDIDVPGVTPK